MQREWEKEASWEAGAVLYCDLGDSCTGVCIYARICYTYVHIHIYMYTYICQNSHTVHLKIMYFMSVTPHKKSYEKKSGDEDAEREWEPKMRREDMFLPPSSVYSSICPRVCLPSICPSIRRLSCKASSVSSWSRTRSGECFSAICFAFE